MSTRDRRKSPRFELFELIGVLARRRHQAGEGGLASLGLNHTEARLLTLLAGEGGASSQDALSRQLSVDRTNAGRAFKRLEQAGYVRRRKHEADTRANLVDITAKGRDAATEANRIRKEMARTFFGDLTDADAATVVALLRKGLGET